MLIFNLFQVFIHIHKILAAQYINIHTMIIYIHIYMYYIYIYKYRTLTSYFVY